MFTDKEVINTINLLKKKEIFTVQNLAKHLGVSKTHLYDKFGHLLPNKREETEQKIIDAIKRQNAITSKSKHTIKDIAKEAGVTRQCISQSYSHLIPIIRGEKPLPDKNDEMSILEDKIYALEIKLQNAQRRHEEEIHNLKNSVLSQFMINDLDQMKGQDLRANIVNLQSQNDELVSLNKDLLKDISQLRSENFSLRNNLDKNPNGCEIIAIVEPDYSAITPSMDYKMIMKLFFEAENKNIDIAIPVCIASKPDTIIFFQPFFSGLFDECHLPKEGRVVIIKSNFPLASIFEKLIQKTEFNNIHAISFQSDDLKLMEYISRGDYNYFHNLEFLEKYQNLIVYPRINDGFKSITLLKPSNKLKVVN